MSTKKRKLKYFMVKQGDRVADCLYVTDGTGHWWLCRSGDYRPLVHIAYHDVDLLVRDSGNMLKRATNKQIDRIINEQDKYPFT